MGTGLSQLRQFAVEICKEGLVSRNDLITALEGMRDRRNAVTHVRFSLQDHHRSPLFRLLFRDGAFLQAPLRRHGEAAEDPWQSSRYQFSQLLGFLIDRLREGIDSMEEMKRRVEAFVQERDHPGRYHNWLGTLNFFSCFEEILFLEGISERGTIAMSTRALGIRFRQLLIRTFSPPS